MRAPRSWLSRTRRDDDPTTVPQRLLDELLSRTPRPRVAVVTGPAGTGLADELRGRGATVATLQGKLPPAALWGRLAGLGPLDLLVDDTRRASPRHAARFRSCFPLLAPGGTYVATPPPVDTEGWPLATLLEELAAEPAEPLQWLSGAVESIDRPDGHLLVVRRGRTLAIMNEPEMNHALEAAPERGRVLATLPAASVDSRCVLRRSQEIQLRVSDRYDAPELYLREYHQVACAPWSVVTQGNLVLPDTYRHKASIQVNDAIEPVTRRFARPPYDEAGLPLLEGSYYHLDNEHRGHFGHVTTEVVSRFWGWEQAKAAVPDLKVLVLINRERRVAGWERMLYEAVGIDPADIVLVEEPVRVERLLSASPMFSMPHYVHPRITETWDRVGEWLRAQVAPEPRPRRIFVTRSHDKRGCVNKDDVERLFADHGFAIVSPEEHPLPVQAHLFHEAEVVAGFAGSGMFNVMFSDRPGKHLITVGSDLYRATNEYMISAVRGHRLDIAFCEATLKVPNPTGRQRRSSPYVCDMEAEGRWVERVLQEL